MAKGAAKDNTVVIIPAYNEARAIRKVVRDIAAAGLAVLVVDDGSLDATAEEARSGGATVLTNDANMGKGASLRKAFRHVADNTDYEWVLVMDGDGQHHPEDIPVLMSEAGSGEADIVVGNRMAEAGAMPFSRYWTNRFTSWVTSLLAGQKVPDSQCGFRLVRTEALKKMDLSSDRYDIESEILLEAGLKGMKIRSAGIKTIYGDEVSKIRPARDTIRFFGLVFKYVLRRFRV